jgi:hypothetical protein
LAAVAARTEDIDTQIIWTNLNIGFVGFGQYGYGDCGGMDSALGFSSWHALDAVDACFKLKMPVSIGSADGESDFFVAAHFVWAFTEQLDFVSMNFRPANIHAVKFTGKQGSLVAAGTSPDFDYGVTLIIGIFRG